MINKNQSSNANGNKRVYKAIVLLITCVFILTIMEGLSMYKNSTCYVHQVPDGEINNYQDFSKPSKLKLSIVRKSQRFSDDYTSANKTISSSPPPTVTIQPNTTLKTTTTLNVPNTEETTTRTNDSQIERQRNLREFCKQSPHLLDDKFTAKNPNMLISDESATIYCYVPKVACTNWKRVYLVLEGKIKDPLDIKRKEDVHTQGYRSFRDFKSDTEIAWRQNLYYSFLFVRHPFERVLSAYRNKFKDPYNPRFQRTYGSTILRMFRKDLSEEQYRAGQNVTFPEFVEYIINVYNERGYKHLNEHWQIMHKLCHPCNIKYNFIGKMDSLIEDSSTVLKEIGWSDRVKFPASAKDKYKSDLKALMKKYYSQIPKDMIDHLYEIYKDDFAAFGYEVDEYLN